MQFNNNEIFHCARCGKGAPTEFAYSIENENEKTELICPICSIRYNQMAIEKLKKFKKVHIFFMICFIISELLFISSLFLGNINMFYVVAICSFFLILFTTVKIKT